MEYNNDDQRTRYLDERERVARGLENLPTVQIGAQTGAPNATQGAEARTQAIGQHGAWSSDRVRVQADGLPSTSGNAAGRQRQAGVQQTRVMSPEAQARARAQAQGQSRARQQAQPIERTQVQPRTRTQRTAQPQQAMYAAAGASKKRRKGQPQTGFVPAGSNARYGYGNGRYGKKPMAGWKKALIALLVIAIMAAAGFFIYKEIRTQMINNELRGNKTDAEIAAIQDELAPPVKYDEPFVLLLIGSDARVEDESMGQRSDTNILVRIDPATNTVSLVSIPRDTMIYIDGAGTNKFNAAYYYGGVAGTIRAVKDLCDVDVNHYAEIDFDGMIGLVDAVGGIDVMVDETIDDPDAGGYIEEGYQHLDGEDTLIFARSRQYYDGDFTRQANQRKVIMALAYKLLETPASELLGLIQVSTSFLTTDMTVEDIKKIADQMRHNNDYDVKIYSAMIPAVAAMVGDVSYVIADTAGVREMMQVFMSGGDVGAVGATDSVYNDVANAGGGTDTSESYEYYEDDDVDYESEPEPEPAPEPEPEPGPAPEPEPELTPEPNPDQGGSGELA